MTAINHDDQLLDANQAAQVLRTSVANFLRLQRIGLGAKSITIDGVEFWRQSALDAYARERTPRGARRAATAGAA
jgi:hypothetical protein